MSFSTNTQNLATRIATEFKTLRTLISGSGTGDVSALATTASNLVAAINELHTEIDDLVSGGGSGDMLSATYDPQGVNGDAFARSNMTGTQNVATISDFTTQVNSLVQAGIDGVTDGASAAFDTLVEIQNALGNDANFANTMTASLANRLRFDATQSLTPTQLQQVQDNAQVYSRTELGDPDTNYVTTFETGLA